MSRPEWVKCIKQHERDPRGPKTWCGRTSEPAEWLFMNVEHADGAEKQGARLQPCPDCRAAAIRARGEKT
jgi:hypothetical protein